MSTGTPQTAEQRAVGGALLQLSTQLEQVHNGILAILEILSPTDDADGNRVAQALENLVEAIAGQTALLREIKVAVEVLGSPGVAQP